jgi:hypothetical protein
VLLAAVGAHALSVQRPQSPLRRAQLRAEVRNGLPVVAHGPPQELVLRRQPQQGVLAGCHSNKGELDQIPNETEKWSRTRPQKQVGGLSPSSATAEAQESQRGVRSQARLAGMGAHGAQNGSHKDDVRYIPRRPPRAQLMLAAERSTPRSTPVALLGSQGGRPPGGGPWCRSRGRAGVSDADSP